MRFPIPNPEHRKSRKRYKPKFQKKLGPPLENTVDIEGYLDQMAYWEMEQKRGRMKPSQKDRKGLEDKIREYHKKEKREKFLRGFGRGNWI